MLRLISSTALFSLWTICSGVHANALQEGDEPPKVTVCQILSDPTAYRGKTVYLSGRIEWDRESFALAGDKCQNTLRTGQHQWLASICLHSSDSAPEPLMRSQALFYDAVRLYEVPLKKGEVRIEATLVGGIEAREEYSARPLSSGRFALNGYCHLNQLPAQLVYSGVIQWTIRYVGLGRP
jgi:hypothetical protein